MFHKSKALLASVATSVRAERRCLCHDKLSGDLVIFSDMSNPAPRAVMEGMVERFGAMHPDLNIELTVIDREAYKTQIRNFLSANPPDVANWYAANRMTSIRGCGPV